MDNLSLLKLLLNSRCDKFMGSLDTLGETGGYILKEKQIKVLYGDRVN